MFLSIFCLDMTWKYNAIVHISQAAAKWVIQPPNDCWTCHDTGDPVVLLVTKLLPDCQCLTFSGTNSASLFSCQIPLPWVFVFLSLVNSPGNIYPGSVLHKKGVGQTRQGSVCRPLSLLASMAVAFPLPRHRLKWEVSGGIHDSR
uniref:Uncharacterized protein n=1 Tax=Myotis myotis TaxID=51298 RepID=A0A7J7UD21_MYOMY|nr:hypothetical protein mMyoMyo1_008730 [Myotis myotis]